MSHKPERGSVVVYLCHNCLPARGGLSRQWMQKSAHIRTVEMPCSGKTDARYLFHALEGGADGICIVACPPGDCHLVQGNYRAEVRVRTVQRLLDEIGMGAERLQMVHFSPHEAPERLKCLVHEAVDRILACGREPEESWAEISEEEDITTAAGQ